MQVLFWLYHFYFAVKKKKGKKKKKKKKKYFNRQKKNLYREKGHCLRREYKGKGERVWQIDEEAMYTRGDK